jgi:D-3-phosphoglycerate dehydrogenase / 2-oxoglutarate reductase
MSIYKVVVSDNRHGDYHIEREILNQCGADLKVADCKTEEDVIRECGDADGILLDMAPMNQTVVNSLKKCKVICRYGVGYDNVNVDACTKKKIYVANVPDYCAEDVSDLALALLFNCIRQVSLRDQKVRSGGWNIHLPHTYRVKDKTLALMGFGRIARCLLHKVSGLGLHNVLVYDPYVPSEAIHALGAEKADMEFALREADYISLHMPVTAETRGMINEQTIGLMKESAILINTARGALIDDRALFNALHQHRIAFAGLDTHNREPLPADSPYFSLDNCVLTDHTAYSTNEAVVELKIKAAENIRAVLMGGRPLYPVNSFNNKEQ